MVSEANKTNRIRGPEFLARYFSGRTLDIGCGKDLVAPSAQPFDQEHGDANRIEAYFEPETFDCVHSSHSLEHMVDAPSALRGWWSLVKPGGHLVIVVPDEDLYEQGYWPSIFNLDHKWTFRLGGAHSWSPKSLDLAGLVGDLPDAEIVSIALQDHGYDRSLLIPTSKVWRRRWAWLVMWISQKRQGVFYRLRAPAWLSHLCSSIELACGRPHAQTDGGALAQIEAVVRKKG